MVKTNSDASEPEPSLLTRRALGQALATGMLTVPTAASADAQEPGSTSSQNANVAPPDLSSVIGFPRMHSGLALTRISMPLGGIGTGGIGLGGRGNLQDWQIYNKPDRGRKPNYALPSVWLKVGDRAPHSRVLEREYLPPYDQMQEGLSQWNAPALPRFKEARFAGSFPTARIDFNDPFFPFEVALEAFCAFQPLDAELSGLPAAFLTYEIRNTSSEPAEVAVAFSLFNPVTLFTPDYTRNSVGGRPLNEIRNATGISGIYMTNPEFAADSPDFGTFALLGIPESNAAQQLQRNWADRWENGAQEFWFDHFAAEGTLGEDREHGSPVGSILQRARVRPGSIARFRFLLAWHFPNRTPARCGWEAPPGHADDIIGNHYANRFADAWAVAEFAAAHREELETATRQFVAALRESTLPSAVLEAASANLCTLVSNTCFRIKDGSFHGFEGWQDSAGWGFGTCKHVWNYETVTHYLFPTLARSMLETSFGAALAESGGIDVRHYLPLGLAHSNGVAADAQMGQLVHLFMEWRASADSAWLQKLWPFAKRALQFAWRPGGWDANGDGVMEGAQSCTYDIELFGPNPVCGSWYLAALHAMGAMAAVMGDHDLSARCGELASRGRRWIDNHLFNGEYYVQRVQGLPKHQIDPTLLLGMGSADTLNPDYQLGACCLADQLPGSYLARLAGLPPLLDADHVSATMRSVFRYNYKRVLGNEPSVQRAYAVNDEAGLSIGDFPRGGRPAVPMPYYSEVMTGFEYAAAISMIQCDMTDEAIECITNVRARFDGFRRNPFDETEYGRNYARAMASWGAIPALAGWVYEAGPGTLHLAPKIRREPHDAVPFRSFWSTPHGWGSFTYQTGVSLQVFCVKGELALRELRLAGVWRASIAASLGGAWIACEVVSAPGGVQVRFADCIRINQQSALLLSG